MRWAPPRRIKMPASEAQKRANAKWQAKTYKYKHVKLHVNNDREILEWLDEKNKEGVTTSGYIKQLIREDMERQANK